LVVAAAVVEILLSLHPLLVVEQAGVQEVVLLGTVTAMLEQVQRDKGQTVGAV
jgi:hypothetical protein